MCEWDMCYGGGGDSFEEIKKQNNILSISVEFCFYINI